MKMVKKTVDAFSDASIKVPFIIPEITENDKDVMRDALNSRLLTDGPKLRKFESLFAKLTGAKFAVGVSNGTAALHLSLKAMGIGKGSEVIIPDLTFVATASSVLLTGATPVLADVDNDLNISPSSIKKSITSKTKAIIPVHFAGKSCKINKIISIARKNKISVIEDCAHAIGAKVNSKHVGIFGQAGCFSFYPTKNFTTIEGGMVITNSKNLAESIRYARNHGITKTLTSRFSSGKPWDYDVKNYGYNYRLDEIRASLGISQIKRIKKMNLLRQKASDYYSKNLGNIEGVIVPNRSMGMEHVHHLYVIRITTKYGITRDVLFQKLLKAGIRTSVHYKPLHKFTIFKKMSKVIDKLSNSVDAYSEILSLPIYPSISKKQQDMVINNIKKCKI